MGQAANAKNDAFERYEALPASYHSDPRWNIVRALRKEGKQMEANGLVMAIRSDFGFE